MTPDIFSSAVASPGRRCSKVAFSLYIPAAFFSPFPVKWTPLFRVLVRDSVDP
jgi:hypothetical protein